MTALTIGKWGNANAIRIPQPFCEQLGLKTGDKVRVFLDGNERIILEPEMSRYSLKGRAQDWDGKRYQSEELDFGAPQGDELL